MGKVFDRMGKEREMSIKHTPGPWQVEWAGGFASSVITAPSWESPIAVVYDHPDRYYQVDGPATEEGEARKAFVVAEKLANARLMAAAPDLLDAAQVALNYIENTESELGIILPSGDMLRAAIAKAVQL